MIYKLANAISDIGHDAWQQLSGIGEPFLRYEWLALLESSGAVSSETGWQPQHLCVYDGEQIVAAMPLYLKSHSYGEYVFDQSWAQAYQHHGLSYYPKLVSCVPFTPVQGARLLFHPICDPVQQQQISQQVLGFIQQYCVEQQLSGAHILFAEAQSPLISSAAECATQWAIRHGCQYHWHNYDYQDFEQFLDACNSKRRKEIRRERRQAQASNLTLLRLTGSEISDAVWLACLKCYQLTNLQYNRHFGYLNPQAFKCWRETMGEQLVVAIAVAADDALDVKDLSTITEQHIVACAVFMRGEQTLYGRYWGAKEHHPALHFELCYYQGIEYCIEQGLRHFDPGAQGEHKIPRGFEPLTTYSLHHLVNTDFQRAVADFVQEEAAALARYQLQLRAKLPFKAADSA